MYIVYGKKKSESRFKAMDMENGVQVGNLIYASLFDLSADEMDKMIASLHEDNPDWDFKYRKTN